MPDSPGRGIERRSTERKNRGSIPAWRAAKAFGDIGGRMRDQFWGRFGVRTKKAENAETRLAVKRKKIDACILQANTTKLQNKPNVCVN